MPEISDTYFWIELISTVLGIWAVWLATRQNVLTWPIGIFSIVLAIITYKHKAFYADLFLQFYYVVSCFYGWYVWNKMGHRESKSSKSIRLTAFALCITLAIILAFPAGYAMQNLNVWLPKYFTEPAAFPFADSIVLTGSLIAQYLMARKIMQHWLLWIVIDILAATLYAQKELYFFAAQYLLFAILAVYGWLNWQKTND